MSSTCKDVTAPNTMWNFCPSVGPAYLFAILFALTTITHLGQAIYYKKAYCWVIILSGLAQTLCYIFRVLSILNPEVFGDYAAWFILILIAPLFTNAFVYMVMGRMVWNYISSAKIYRITAWRFGTFFVILDVCALLVQIVGAASASGNNEANNKVLDGLHIYMVGVGIQQAFILLFFVFAIKFHRTYLAESRQQKKGNSPLVLLYVMYAALALITLRIIFRLCEYAQGLNSKIPNHEAFQYCLDSLPMLIALVLFNIVHPGRVMAGKESSIPGRKERKYKHVSNKAERESLGENMQVLGA
ncbi:uncharacterized protein LY89DRAFT_633035 [Mollisia scopiformis]|uniref:RTA1-like protein n=1 Tax=Mollisia scopiformis TaxID=149040 RepID=A0A132B210_MOLSC|nr:uncharacterized protein LY89DRAFT_633035 [Mollisia scopiformis]KUJ06420.1 hypothetical protein LY89DRAFT_633035 [Mollisia scopiformis]